MLERLDALLFYIFDPTFFNRKNVENQYIAELSDIIAKYYTPILNERDPPVKTNIEDRLISEINNFLSEKGQNPIPKRIFQRIFQFREYPRFPTLTSLINPMTYYWAFMEPQISLHSCFDEINANRDHNTILSAEVSPILCQGSEALKLEIFKNLPIEAFFNEDRTSLSIVFSLSQVGLEPTSSAIILRRLLNEAEALDINKVMMWQWIIQFFIDTKFSTPKGYLFLKRGEFWQEYSEEERAKYNLGRETHAHYVQKPYLPIFQKLKDMVTEKDLINFCKALIITIPQNTSSFENQEFCQIISEMGLGKQFDTENIYRNNIKGPTQLHDYYAEFRSHFKSYLNQHLKAITKILSNLETLYENDIIAQASSLLPNELMVHLFDIAFDTDEITKKLTTHILHKYKLEEIKNPSENMLNELVEALASIIEKPLEAYLAQHFYPTAQNATEDEVATANGKRLISATELNSYDMEKFLSSHLPARLKRKFSPKNTAGIVDESQNESSAPAPSTLPAETPLLSINHSQRSSQPTSTLPGQESSSTATPHRHLARE